MVDVNLLPWRVMLKEERMKQRQCFLIILASITLLWMITHLGFNCFLQAMDTHQQELQDQLITLSGQTQQKQVDSSFMMINQIQLNQKELLHFFKSIMNENSMWSEIASKNNQINLFGMMDSYEMLTEFVKRYHFLNNTNLMTILNVKTVENSSAISFHVQIARAVMTCLSEIQKDNASA